MTHTSQPTYIMTSNMLTETRNRSSQTTWIVSPLPSLNATTADLTALSSQLPQLERSAPPALSLPTFDGNQEN